MSTVSKNFNPSREDEQDVEISFSFFQDGSEGVNLGLGAAAPSDFCVEAPPRKKEKPVDFESTEPINDTSTRSPGQKFMLSVEPDESLVSDNPSPVEGEQPTTSGLLIHENPEYIEQDAIDFNKLVEQSRERFEEVKYILSSPLESLESKPEVASQKSDSFSIEEVVDVAPLMDDIEQLEQDYEEATTKVKEVIVQVDKRTAADRAGKAVNWWTQTFIITPTSWIFKRLHNGIRDIIGGIYRLLLIVLGVIFFSIFATIMGYAAWQVYKYDAVPYDAFMTAYDAVKGLIVRLYKDIQASMG